MAHENFWGDPPAGKGSFTLSIKVSDSGRTILPVINPDVIVLYTLDFTPTNGGTELKESRNKTNINAPIYLDPGTYKLEVKAYLDEGKTKLAAQATVDDLEINAGENAGRTITLNSINKTGGEGSFQYEVTLPSITTKAMMEITPLGETEPLHNVDLIISGATGSLPLNTGYYNVVFTLENSGNQKLVWREFLHIYDNLVSSFEMEFTDDYFSITSYTVTFIQYNDDDNWERSVQHGGKVDKPSDPTKDGHTFVNWYTDNTFATLFDFEKQITYDTTVHANYNVNVTGITLNQTTLTLTVGGTATLTAAPDGFTVAMRVAVLFISLPRRSVVWFNDMPVTFTL
jgi:hypothetical protein